MKLDLRVYIFAVICMGLSAMASPASAACIKSVEDVNGDGFREVILENDLIRLVFPPAKGAECVSVSSKDGTLPEKAFQYNLFDTQDGRWINYGVNQPFSKVPFAYEFEKNDAKEIILHMWRQGGDYFRYVTLHLRIRLLEGRSSFTAEYLLEHAAEGDRCECKLWIHNWMTPTEGAATCYLADLKGVMSAIYTANQGAETPAGAQTIKLWATDAPRGWMAVKQGVPSQTAPGVAFAMDWQQTKNIYFWYSKVAVTPEWRYAACRLKGAESFKTLVQVMPFVGLENVDHAESGLVFDTGLTNEVQQAGKKILRIAFDAPRTVQAELSVRPVKILDNPPFEFRHVADKEVTAEGWKTVGIAYELPELAPGEHVLKCRITEGGVCIVDFERRFDMSEAASASTYVYAPIKEKTFEEIAVKSYFPWQPSREVETPHFDAYDPMPGAPARLLYLGKFGSHSGPTCRTVVELAQRMSLDYTAPPLDPWTFIGLADPVSSTSGLVDPLQYRRHLPDHLKADQSYDVILIENLGNLWNTIPAVAKVRIGELVKQGTGLIVSCWPTPEYGDIHKIYSELQEQQDQTDLDKNPTARSLAEWMGLEAVKDLMKRKLLVCGTYGKGKAVFFEGWAVQNLLCGGQNQTRMSRKETYYSRLAKLVLWGANKDLPVKIVSAALADPDLDEENWDDQKLQLVCQAVKDEDGVTAELSWCSEKPQMDFVRFADKKKGTPAPYYEPEWEQYRTETVPCALKQGLNILTLPAAPAPAGVNELWIRLTKAGQVLGSEVLRFQVKPSAAVQAVQLDADIVKPAQPMKASVQIKNHGKKERALTCRLRVNDIYDREFAVKTEPVTLSPGQEKTVELSFNSGSPVAVLHTVRADLCEGERIISSEIAEYTVPSLTEKIDDWYSYSWAKGDPMILAAVKKLGFDGNFTGFTRNKNPELSRANMRISAAYGLDHVAGSMGSALGFDWQQGERLVRKVSFSDPDYLKTERTELLIQARLAHRYGVPVFILAGEPSLGTWECGFHNQFDWSPASLANFRGEWLKNTYGGIEALNREWDTSYSSFDAVEPAVESEIKDKDNLAPWQDFRAHMNHEVAKLYRVLRGALTSCNSDAYMGVEGVSDGHPYSGFDWWEMSDAVDWSNHYNYSLTMRRSLTPRSKLCKYENWLWPYHLFWDIAWNDFFDGSTMHRYWQHNILINPDYTLNEKHVRPIREIIATFKSGVGKLMLDTTRQDKDLVIHYSQPSIHVAKLMSNWHNEVNKGIEFYRNNRNSLEQAFFDAGQDPSYLAYAQIEQGLLKQRKPQVLVLPMSIALSEKEVKEIEQFVSDGGVLVGDVCCALRDNHGKPWPEAALDKVFGIQRGVSDRDTLKRIEGEFQDEPGKTAIFIEKGIKAVSAKPLTAFKPSDKDPVPLVYVNSYGKGKAIYLGFVGQYINGTDIGETIGRGRHDLVSLRHLYRRILEEQAGMKEKYRVMDGTEPAPGKTMRYSFGDADYIGYYSDLANNIPASRDYCDVTDEDIKNGTRNLSMRLPEKKYVYEIMLGKCLGRVDQFSFTAPPGRGQLFSILPYSVKNININVPSQIAPVEIFSIGAALEKEGSGKGRVI
ncbi:MAG: beta-galactosidase trimerization domain-containing protein [Planctomycetes bacterium]|nr:beta-galactosidase trimerization domain-containing protein [Planctomycetota bacterium]